jgi:methylenetetrahydrofolate reductase (NADPH)
LKDAPDKPSNEVDTDLLVTATSAAHDATQSLASITFIDGEAGRGELNNAASWDDFPNGRFGDFKSPAFGAQDPWGNSGVAVRLSFCRASSGV